jgi:malonyl CoA-acyl carrier protein transacylase
MLAFVFPGQGSQKRGMGQGLFDEVKEFRDAERDIDECLGYSVRKLCLEDEENRLKETQYTQPCLFVVNALHYYKAIRDGAKPDFLAGHSVGEYNALLAAGAIDFMTGLRLVKKRGEVMAKAKNGGMAAVIGLSTDAVAGVLLRNALTGIDVANYNSPTQTVISGPVVDIKRAGPMFDAAGAQLYIELPVSAAFHSRYMAEASREFGGFLSTISFQPLEVPVVTNVTAELYPRTGASAEIKLLLEQQIVRPVKWTQSILHLLKMGVTNFSEIGPGTVLSRLVQQIRTAEPQVSAVVR